MPSFWGSKFFETVMPYQTLPVTPFFTFPAIAAFGEAPFSRHRIGEHVPIAVRRFNILWLSRRDPIFAFEFDASLFAFAYDTPPFAFALLLPR